VAYQSEIELRVKVVDKELKDLEQKVKNIQSRTKAVNPFSASGAAKENKKAVELQQRLMGAEKARLSVDKNRLQLAEKLNVARIKNTNLNTSWFKTLQTGKQIQLDINKAVKREGDLRKKAKSRARQRKFTDVATGFGFPLLFGGGPLQALAGGIGGAAGGLGGSIAASALVAQVEAFAKGTAATGQSLNSLSGTLELMREKTLFSEGATARLATELEGLGNIKELSALLTKELVQKIGNDGVNALQDLGKESDKTTRLWSELTLQLQVLIAGPLKDFFALLNSVIGAVTTNNQFKVLEKELTGQARKDFETEVARRKALNLAAIAPGSKSASASSMMSGTGTKSGVGSLSSGDRRELVEQFLPQLRVTAKIPDLGGIKPPKDTAGEKAAREEARIQQRLAALEVERKKILEISGFKDKIAAAEAANDSQLVIRLQGEQRIAGIEAKRLSDLTKVTDQRLIDSININAATQKLAAQRETERQITEEQRKRQELFDTTIEDLEHQLRMTEATSQAERDRLKIAKELKKLEKQGFSDSQLGQAESVMKRLAVAQQPLNAFIRKATEDLNNLQQVAVDVSQGIGNAIGNSLVSGLQSLITGAASIKEVFANMLKSVADVLAKTAAEMIARYIAIGIARAFAGMGTGGPDPNSAGVTSVLESGGFTTGNLADAAISGASFATGGYVSSPTNALIGEGGEPEYVIPESKMRTAMSRYSRGSRGNSVIPESGATEAIGGGGGTAVAAPIDVRYTVERINSVDYVTADQFQVGMQQAAQQGAKQGEQQTLKRLQMSGSTRKRIGI